MKKLNLITACALSYEVLNGLPVLDVCVNTLMKQLEVLGYELHPLDDKSTQDDIDKYNAIFWPVLFCTFDCSIINKDVKYDDIGFIRRGDLYGLLFGCVFYHK